MDRHEADERYDVFRDGFTAVANEPRAWRSCARHLLAAADLVARDCRLDFPTQPTDANVAAAEHTAHLLGGLLLLRAAAVECLLKAYYVRDVGQLAEDGSFGKSNIKNHDLPAVAKQARLPPATVDEELLNVLGDWVMRGRYPVLLNWRDHFFGRLGPRPAWTADREIRFQALVEKLFSGLAD